MIKKILPLLWLWLVLAFIYVPILILAFYSFTDATMVGGSVGSLSFDNYLNLFGNEDLRNMIFVNISWRKEVHSII